MSKEKEKVELKSVVSGQTSISHNDADVRVETFITLPQQVLAINTYVKEYFFNPEHSVIDGTETRYLEAQYALKSVIMQLCTNIKIDENIDQDIFYDNILWKKITSAILNYADFEHSLNYIVSEIKEQKALKLSVGSVVEKLVSKGYEVLNSFSEVNPEELKEIVETGKDLLKKLEESPAFPLLSEAGREKSATGK